MRIPSEAPQPFAIEIDRRYLRPETNFATSAAASILTGFIFPLPSLMASSTPACLAEGRGQPNENDSLSAIDEITATDLAGDYPAIQYVAPDGTPIDILSRLGEAFEFAGVEATVYSYGDVDVKVATPEMLYRMKRDTVRLQDKADAQALREKFGLKE
jgi:hypothetical protein